MQVSLPRFIVSATVRNMSSIRIYEKQIEKSTQIFEKNLRWIEFKSLLIVLAYLTNICSAFLFHSYHLNNFFLHWRWISFVLNGLKYLKVSQITKLQYLYHVWRWKFFVVISFIDCCLTITAKFSDHLKANSTIHHI